MEFNFSALWESGPWKKVGRVMANQRFQESVKTEEDYKNILAARDAYSAYCQANPWYTPVQGAVWFGKRKGWREWIPDDVEAKADDPIPIHHVHVCRICLFAHEWLHEDPLCWMSREVACSEALAEIKKRRAAVK